MMGYADHLWQLLRPMGPYRDRGKFTAGELAGEGLALDGVQSEVELLEREALLDTAQSFGLDRIEELLTSRPVTETVEGRQLALAALLRIGGDSFTLDAINDNLQGCGINAAVRETADPGVVEVYFPDVPGIPKGYAEMRKIIEEILPCHLQINYVFWYITWALLEKRFKTWRELESGHYTWVELENLVK